TVLKTVILLLAIASTALISHTLRGALFMTFALPVAVFAYLTVNMAMPVEAIMVALLAVSLGFFTFVARHMNRSAVMLLSYQA
ncbi:hypothetical protein, partial [Clostridium perfringens]